MGFGSNTGNSIEIFQGALNDIRLLLIDVCVSSVYSSKPLYLREQPDFYNFALAGNTALLPHELLKETQRIEAKYGRNRDKEVSKGPRTLDIDILLYDNEILHDFDLTIPHPGIRERAFVLMPLLDLAPDLQLPGDSRKLKEYLPLCKDQGIYQLPGTII